MAGRYQFRRRLGRFGSFPSVELVGGGEGRTCQPACPRGGQLQALHPLDFRRAAALIDEDSRVAPGAAKERASRELGCVNRDTGVNRFDGRADRAAFIVPIDQDMGAGRQWNVGWVVVVVIAVSPTHWLVNE